MFKKVIVGVDGGEGGLDAIALAELLRAEDAELALANIYPSEALAWRGANAAYEAVLREDSVRLLEKAREATGVEASLHGQGAPNVGRGLHEIAEKLDADLIVVGSSRRAHLGRVFSADDTRRALNGASSAVAVAPTGYSKAEHSLRTIGVGFDESPESEHALVIAQLIAAERQARVAALEVLYFPAPMYVDFFPGKDEIRQLLENAETRIGQIQGVEPHAAYGVPEEELAGFSGSVDLMVVGSRGYGPVGRLLYGSTAQALARMSRCPLLVLTRRTVGKAPSSADETAEIAHA